MPASLVTGSRTARTHRALAAAHGRITARDSITIETQVAVSEIAAPTGEERARAEWVARRLRGFGLSDARIDAAGNVVAMRVGTERVQPVLVCAHLDTVFPRDVALTFRRDGDRLMGPGIGDNGRGLAAMLAIAEEIDGHALATRRPIVFVATTGEEGAGDLRGAKYLFAHLDDEPAAAIALDGAGDERIVHKALGSRRYRISYRGAGGHSWAAFGIPNPVHAAASAASMLASLPLPKTPRTTLSVSRIGGGTSINSIPEEGWLEVDLRSTASSVLDRFDREIRIIVRAAAQQENARRATATPPLSHDVMVIGDRPSGELSSDHPLVVSAVEATQLIDREPELAAASTDANVPIALGVPAIAIGAGGRGGDAHTTGEWYDNTDGPLGIARALTILATAAELV
ncbi:MAG TPA: M20/M25/M40 family metallo-hydrolase [Gemmatimonadaceae bacterium]|nr:M20/M25/M40 family metallo-hydrolase [Gemmatimonadaceae bacterium]